MTELEQLQDRINSSYSAFLLLEFASALPFPDESKSAAALRWKQLWNDPEALKGVLLRGEHLSESEALALAKEDRRRFDDLLAEDDRREKADRNRRALALKNGDDGPELEEESV